MSWSRFHTVRYESDAFPRFNLLQRRIKNFPKVVESLPSETLQRPCIRFLCNRKFADNLQRNSNQFSVKGILGEVIDEKDVNDSTLIVTLCILKPNEYGELTQKDKETLKVIKDSEPDHDITTVVFAVNRTECNSHMLEECSKEISRYVEPNSTVNSIFSRLFPIESTEISVRISLYLEMIILNNLPVTLTKAGAHAELKSQTYLPESGIILINGPLKDITCQDMLRRKAKDFQLEEEMTHKFSLKKIKVSKFQNYLSECISHEIALTLQKQLNKTGYSENMDVADGLDKTIAQPVLHDSLVIFISKVINSRIEGRLESYTDSLCSVDDSFRHKIADEICQSVMEERDNIVLAVLSKFRDVYLEYIRLSDLINVFAARNKIDATFHEYKTITERNLQIKACGLFGKIIKIYIREKVRDEDVIQKYLLKYNKDISVVRICEYQEMTIRKHMLMSGLKVKQSQSSQARYGTVSFPLKDGNGQYYCATCKHVLEGASSFYIQTDDGTLCRSNSFYVSEDVDFALLKLQNENLCGPHGIRYRKNNFLPGELLENDMMPNENDKVYKWGATTGRTFGTFQGVLCTRKQENGNYDIETFIVEGLDGKFSEEGDSGSLVCIKPDSIVYTSHMAAFILIGEVQKYAGIDYENTHACYRVSIPLMEMKKNKACSNIIPCFF